MESNKRQVPSSTLIRIGRKIRSAIPFVLLTIGLTFWLMLPLIHAGEKAELKAKIAALESQNKMYELQVDYLHQEIGWLRSLIETE